LDRQNSKYRWIVFTAVLFSYFLIVSQRTAPGLITDQIMKDFSISASTIGLLSSVQFLAYAGLQIPIGIMSDRFGPAYFLIIGALLNGIGTILYSVAANEFFLFLARLLAGIGDAAIWVNLVLILSQWFKVSEFVRLLGFAGMAGSLGFLMATVPFSVWISQLGWRPPFFIVGIILCFCAVLLFYVLVTKPVRLCLSTKETMKKEGKKEKTRTMLRRIFSDRQAWAAFLCHFGAVGTYVGFIGTWAVPFGMNVYGMTRGAASQLIMIGLIGALIGAPLTTWISGKVQSIKRPYVLIHIIIFLGWTMFLLFHGKPPYVLLIILFLAIGYGNGGSALTFAVVRDSFAMKEVGFVSGFANTGGFISAVLLPTIFGKVLDHFHTASSSTGYQYGFFIPVFFSLLGLIGGIMIKEKRLGERQAKEALV